MKKLRKNQKEKEAVPEGRASDASLLARDFAFLCRTPRIHNEHERHQLLDEEPRIPLNPHEPPAGDVHENVPEITAYSFFRKQIGANKKSQHEADFQPLIDCGDATKIVKAVAEPERDADERKAVKPTWRIVGSATKSEDEPKQHCRSTTRFHGSRNPVPPHDENDYPWRQTEQVHRPRGNPPLACGCLLTAISRVFREPQKDLVEEVADTSPHLQEDIHSDLLRVFECALPRPLAWPSSRNYVFPTILEVSILEHKSQETASAVSWVRISMIKKFSFLFSPKTWFEPIVFPGSLAVLKSRGEAAPNSRGVSCQNAFGLIQEYCTSEEIASFECSPRFARRLIRIGFSGQKRIGDFERRKENFLIQII